MDQIDNSFSEQFSPAVEGDDIDTYTPGEDYQPYGLSRKSWGGEPMLNFVDRGGKQHAKPWSQLDDIVYEPSTGITITYINHVITLKGRNLDLIEEGKGASLHGYLLRQRTTYITESDRAVDMGLAQEDVVITEMLITPKHEELQTQNLLD